MTSANSAGVEVKRSEVSKMEKSRRTAKVRS